MIRKITKKHGLSNSWILIIYNGYDYYSNFNCFKFSRQAKEKLDEYLKISLALNIKITAKRHVY